MSIRVKILGAFLIISLFAALLGVTGLVATQMETQKMAELRNAIHLSNSFTNILNAHYAWRNGLNETVLTGVEFTGSLDHTSCALGKWLSSEEAAKITDPKIKSLLDSIAAPHEFIHREAANVVDYVKAGDEDSATRLLIDTLMPSFNIVVTNLVTISDLIDEGTAVLEQDTYSISDITIKVIIALILIVLGACVFLALKFANSISKPLVVLSSFMKNASNTGDISLRPEDEVIIKGYSASKDEIGVTVASCAAFMMRITEISQLLSTVASGDLTLDIDMLSDKDTMGLSLHNLLVNLKRMFTEIRGSAEQVKDGAKQMAEAAQTLAQGSTEQAASIEQLSSAMSDIADKTKTNAHKADEASRLADTIKGNAEKGSRQMNEMMEAVNEINEASGSIGKVIKVIDDIAFQTNILALNAAVEAARAGQHGKGFAVVAEEVRNLAAKSAEAAKDTGSLIDNSIEKASLGARIAHDTAESLSEIVSGINDSSLLVGEIARSSEEQSLSIDQINTGIDQVAQVVQHNSATAQEEAAASQVMNSQSATLQDLIGQFKLDNYESRRPLIQGQGGASKQAAMPAAAPKLVYPAVSGDYGKF